MLHTISIKYTEYDIHCKGVPELHYAHELIIALKKFAMKDSYDKFDIMDRSGPINPYSYHAINSRHAKIPDSEVIQIIPLLKRCFPKITFRISGQFIYGPGDKIDEHTNANDPTDVLYITYATGKSKFSYRYDINDDFIDTYDIINGITLRAFTVTSNQPYTFHKVECESGYRVSLGLRYVAI